MVSIRKDPEAAVVIPDLGGPVDYEALNRYVLILILLFGIVLYLGLMYAGLIQFVVTLRKRTSRKRRFPNRRGARGLSNEKRTT